MLCELMVDGLGVIDHAELDLPGGLIALTGETGAGKTLIVAALGLLLGDRADRSLIRSGHERALVEGRFVLRAGHPAMGLLAQAGFPPDADEVVISREVFRDDRPTRVRVNGRMATVAMLSELSAALVDVAGQHEHQRLADAAARRSLLDAAAGPQAVQIASDVQRLVRASAEASAVLADLQEGLANRERELDILRFEVGEIAGVDVKPGEIDGLKREAAVHEGAQGMAEAVDRAGAALIGDDGAQDLVADAIAALEKTAAGDVEPLLESLRNAEAEIANAGLGLARLTTTSDPTRLDAIRARLDAIAKLVRKYGSQPDAASPEESIVAYRTRAEARIAELDSIDDRIDRARERAGRAREEALAGAAKLSRLRDKGRVKLDRAVEDMLGRLAMQGARFATDLQVRELYEGGLETVDFQVAANPGDELRPIARVASGGELSRIALALHVAASTSSASTVVFDEVDAGVGGQAAQSVGRALVELARTSGSQVIVVTHLPQVAAFADTHYRVSKDAQGASVARVDGVERVEELSRMLAGLPESDRARQHAEELLVLASEATRR